jgi:hypothetical protein
MLVRAIVPGTLLLAGSAIAGAVHPARDATTSSVFPVTQERNPTFTSVAAITSYAYDVTQPVYTSSYVSDEVWTSSIGPEYTSAPCYCPVPISIPYVDHTSSIQEPITMTVTVDPSSSGIPTTLYASSPGIHAVTSSIQEPSPTTMVVSVAPNVYIRDAVTSSIQEPTPTTMVVTILPTSSGIPGPVTICSCGVPSASPVIVTSTQSVVDQPTQSAGVPVTQSIQGVPTTQSVSRSASSETASVANNLLLNANSAAMEVVSVRLVTIAVFFALVGAGFTLI